MPEAERGRRQVGRRRSIVTGWALLSGGAIVLLVAARSARYLLHDPSDEVLSTLGGVLFLCTRALLVSFTWLHLNALPPLAFLLCALLRRRWCLGQDAEGRWRLASWLHALAWLQLVYNQHFFDMNVAVATFVWATLPMTVLLPALARRWPGRFVWTAAWGVAAIVGAALVPSAADVLGVIVWTAACAALHGPGARVLGGLERALLTAIAIPAAQLLAATSDLAGMAVLAVGVAAAAIVLRRWRRPLGWRLTLILPGMALVTLTLAMDLKGRAFPHGGTRLGEGLAYSFCELPERHLLVAAVPNCGVGGEACRRGEIVYYDIPGSPSASPSSVADGAPPWRSRRHRIFDGRFSGRLEQAVCMGDRIEVGMCCVDDGARSRDEEAIGFPPDAPARFEVGLKGTPLLRRLVYDPVRDVVFYAGGGLRRLDRRTGAISSRLEAAVGAAMPRDGRRAGIYTVDTSAIHRRRNSVFVAEFLDGSRVYELDLDTERVKSAFDAHNSGVLAVTVDEAMDRLYISGLLGIDVYDLAAGRMVARLRTGLLARTTVIDAQRDLLYVPTTVEGRIHVFDRRSLRRRGTIPVGIETRNALLTRDGRWFAGSGAHEHYVWDADRLARRFGWAGPRAEQKPGTGVAP